MSIAEPPAAPPPARIEVDRVQHLQLLVKTSVTDPAAWPPGYAHCAALVARIRQIEQDCVALHGKWDITALSEELDNEYEDCIARLEDSIEPYDPNGPRYSHAEVFADVIAAREQDDRQ